MARVVGFGAVDTTTGRRTGPRTGRQGHLPAHSDRARPEGGSATAGAGPRAGTDAARATARQRDRVLVAAFLSGMGGRLLTPFFGAMALAVATHSLDHVRYGVVATTASLLGLLIFADLGIGNAFMTRLAAAHGRGDEREMRVLVSSAWYLLLAVSVVLLAGGLAAAALVPWEEVLGAPQLPAATVRAAVAAFAVLLAVNIPSVVGLRILMAVGRGAAANVWTVGAAVLTPAAVAVTAVLHLPLWTFVISTVGMATVVGVVQTWWVLVVSCPHLRPRWADVSRGSARALIGVSGLFLALNVASAVGFQADAVIVASLRGAALAAVYAIAYRLFKMVAGLAINGSEQLWTVATAAVATGDIAWLRSRMLRVTGATAVAIGLASCLLVVVGRPLIRVWAGPGLVPPAALLVVLAVWTTYAVLMEQVVFLLNAADLVRPQVPMALAMAAVNVGLSLYLTRRFGLVGPVLGSLFAHVVCYGIPASIYAARVLAGPRLASGAAP